MLPLLSRSAASEARWDWGASERARPLWATSVPQVSSRARCLLSAVHLRIYKVKADSERSSRGNAQPRVALQPHDSLQLMLASAARSLRARDQPA